MNISDFTITVIVSLLTGIGLGLTIKEVWHFLVKITAKAIKKNTLKTVDFSYFFGNHNEETR